MVLLCRVWWGPMSRLPRYTSDGLLDASFSGDGIATLSYPESERLVGFTILPDGRIVAIVQVGPSV